MFKITIAAALCGEIYSRDTIPDDLTASSESKD